MVEYHLRITPRGSPRPVRREWRPRPWSETPPPRPAASCPSRPSRTPPWTARAQSSTHSSGPPTNGFASGCAPPATNPRIGSTTSFTRTRAGYAPPLSRCVCEMGRSWARSYAARTARSARARNVSWNRTQELVSHTWNGSPCSPRSAV